MTRGFQLLGQQIRLQNQVINILIEGASDEQKKRINQIKDENIPVESAIQYKGTRTNESSG